MILCPLRFKEFEDGKQGCDRRCALFVVDRNGNLRCALSLASNETRTAYNPVKAGFDKN